MALTGRYVIQHAPRGAKFYDSAVTNDAELALKYMRIVAHHDRFRGVVQVMNSAGVKVASITANEEVN